MRLEDILAMPLPAKQSTEQNANVLCRSSSCRLEESLSASIRAQKEISDQLSLLVGVMAPNRSLTDESVDTTTKLGSANGGTNVDWPNAVTNLSQVRIGKATLGQFPARTPRRSEGFLGRQEDSLGNQSPITIKNKCKTFCSCNCHTHSICRSPWILEPIIGKLNVQLTGRRLPCSKFHCCRSPEFSFKVVYQFPNHLINRYVSMIMQYSRPSGPEFLLRVPRVVPWSHLLWNYTINGDLLAIQKLFAEGKASPYDLNPRGSNAFYYAGHRDPRRLYRYFLEQGMDMDHPNDVGRTASDIIWEYSLVGNSGIDGKNVFRGMLRDSDHVQTRGFSALHKIIMGLSHDDLESVLEISTADINVGDSSNMTPLCLATLRNDVQAVKLLLSYGANPNILDKWGRTPLFFARNTDICKMLLDAGVNIHTRNAILARSALHQRYTLISRWYVESDTVDTIDLLVNAGIDVDVRDGLGRTPLLAAVYSGYTSHARRLLELGANPNVCSDTSHHSAIHNAVLFNRHELIPLLLERGADYTALNANGMNIAHMAAWSASTETVSVLADSNLVDLDMSLRCEEGKTPADYLSERSILTESEQGLHAEFKRFMESLPSSSVEGASRVPKAEALHDSSDKRNIFHLPGAYPVIPDTDISL